MKNKEKYNLRFVDYHITEFYDYVERKKTYSILIKVIGEGLVANKEILYTTCNLGWNDKDLVERVAWNGFRSWLEEEVQENER